MASNRPFGPRTHGNVFLRFCIAYCSQGNREQPAHYLKQYKNAGKRFRVYGALINVETEMRMFTQATSTRFLAKTETFLFVFGNAELRHKNDYCI